MMAECPQFQFQMSPQMVPIYRSRMPPPPPPNAFPIPGQPLYPMPPHFAYPPIAWSPVRHFTPPHIQQQMSYHSHSTSMGEDKEDIHDYPSVQIEYEGNSAEIDEPLQQASSAQRPHSQSPYTRFVSNKFDTRHEEFRKYVEEVGILSTYSNILIEMYQDPLRPTDPLGYIRDKLYCSRPETIELSNLRLWCEQYQIKTARLEKELQHVIELLRKYEPYISDDSLLNQISSGNDCQSCELNVAKQEHTQENKGSKEENVGYETIISLVSS